VLYIGIYTDIYEYYLNLLLTLDVSDVAKLYLDKIKRVQIYSGDVQLFAFPSFTSQSSRHFLKVISH